MTWNSTLVRTKPLQARAPMKRAAWTKHAPKKRAGHNKAYLNACRGELCYLRIPGICIGGIDTTVPAHSNEQAHGKGMGLKADDRYTVPACMACHHEIDQGSRPSKHERFAIWRAAYAAWEPVRAAKLNQKTNPATARTVPGLSIAQA